MLSLDEKIYLRSIKVLANSMVSEERIGERQIIADEVSKLIEDYIAECSGEKVEEKSKQQEVTIEMNNNIVDYFNKMAEDTGIPFHILINICLSDCAKEKKELRFV